ncbi:MAG: hypothetical protein QM644_18400 [Mobilitalea sp.]
MLDTSTNIDTTIQELHEAFSEIDTSEEKYENIDLSYLDEE